MTARPRSLGFMLGLALIVNTACGSEVSSAGPVVAEPPVVVDADETAVLGELTQEQRGMVDWALDRFALAGLQLPVEIEIIFDPTAARCDGKAGCCHPANGHAVVIVCEPSGETMGRIIDRRVALLHELAHLWHWGQGDGLEWLDQTGIVGGEVGSPQVPWEDRAEERVAIAVAWGVMDQLRRPVGSDLPCAELNEQFQRLTGRQPLGPIDTVCAL